MVSGSSISDDTRYVSSSTSDTPCPDIEKQHFIRVVVISSKNHISGLLAFSFDLSS